MIVFEWALEGSCYVLLMVIVWKLIIGIATGRFAKAIAKFHEDL